MPGPFTEFAYFAHKPGLDIWNESTPEGKAMQTAFNTALQQPGAQQASFGFEIEKPENVWLFLDWASVEDHMKYRKTETHDEITKTLIPYLDFSQGFISHVTFTPHPLSPVLDKTQAPVTEVVTAWFPAAIAPASKETVAARFGEFAEKALTTCPDFKGISSGWSVEDDVPVRGEDGRTGVLFAVFIGWSSLEAHMRFRETVEFKKAVGLLQDLPELIKIEVFHVSCTRKDASEA